MHPCPVGGIQRNIAHAQQRLAVLWLGNAAFRHAEMLRSEFASGFFDQQNLAVDGVGHGVSSPGRHCERQRSNPEGTKQGLDCLVARLLAMTESALHWHASEVYCAGFKTCDNL